MALTFGFYNSLNGDRKYNAKQFGSIFDGVIHDGVYINIGNRLMVKATGTNMQVIIQTGRAWFNHTWTLNDTDYPITLPNAEPLLPKYVAVVLEVNETQSIRGNRFVTVAGTPSTNPQYPTLTNNSQIHQYPLAYVLIPAGATKINQGNITNKVGTSVCPFVTSVAASMNIDDLIAKWEVQWNEMIMADKTQWNNLISNSNTQWATFMSNSDTEFDTMMAEDRTYWDDFVNRTSTFFNDANTEFGTFMQNSRSSFSNFINAKNDEFEDALDDMYTDFNSFWTDFKAGMVEYLQAQEDIWTAWFQRIQGQLSEDAATNLQRQIDAFCYVYVMGERAVLSITATAAHNRVIFGTYGSVTGDKIIVSAPTISVTP